MRLDITGKLMRGTPYCKGAGTRAITVVEVYER